MTGKTLTIDELQAYKTKAKRQRDNWKRRALKYLDQLGVARIELDVARIERGSALDAFEVVAWQANMRATEASAAQADYRRAIDALGTAYRLIIKHHNCGKPIVLGRCGQQGVREDGTSPELDQITSVLREARAKLIDKAETRRQEPPKGDT
jgi:hypothetical protein